MGGTLYNHNSRSLRTNQYLSQNFNQTFTQQSEGKIHNSMDPREIRLRESRDSDVHPETVPIIFALDGTGSMDFIPKHMIGHGLPTLISNLEERGVKDPAILFMVIGDSKGRDGRGDDAPLQVGQFESGDKELDMWLTRSWIEGGGWGNDGESYGWSWWFAANRCITDAWEKRGMKGFLFTVGDEKCHHIDGNEFQRVLGITHEFASREDLYKKASEKWNVFHICLERGGSDVYKDWRSFIGENCILVKDHEAIPEVIAKIIGERVVSKSDVTVDTKKSSDIKITL